MKEGYNTVQSLIRDAAKAFIIASCVGAVLWLLTEILPVTWVILSIVWATLAIGATWIYFGKRFLWGAGIMSAGVIYAGYVNKATAVWVNGVELAERTGNPFAVARYSETPFHNTWMATALAAGVIVVGLYVFWRTWKA